MKEFKIWRRVAICGLVVSLTALLALFVWMAIDAYWVYGIFVIMAAALGAVAFSLWEVVHPSKEVQELIKMAYDNDILEEVEDDDDQ